MRLSHVTGLLFGSSFCLRQLTDISKMTLSRLEYYCVGTCNYSERLESVKKYLFHISSIEMLKLFLKTCT